MTTPAIPMLASDLFDVHGYPGHDGKREQLGSACTPIDDALRGGLDYGCITCISGEKGTGKTAISLQLLATHLFSSPGAQAAVIDTTGAFDILRFHRAILLRLKAQNRSGRHHEADDESVAEEALGRVKIMRVFDLVGVSEAVNELKEEFKPAPSPSPGSRVVGIGRDEVPDSEDDDEMLLDIDAGARPRNDLRISDNPRQDDNVKLGLLVVDNIAHVVNPLLKKNYAQGHAIFLTFMRSLSHSTSSYSMSTVLINSAVSPRQNYSEQKSKAAPSSSWIQDPTAQSPSFFDQPSIFAATTARPALGKPFSYCVDLHLLLSILPKQRGDAEIVYGGKTGSAQYVNVMEVLSDRWEGRLGRWAAFVVENGASLKAAL